MRPLLILMASAGLALSLGLTAAVHAQGKSGKGAKAVPKGQVQRHLNGAPKDIPPGQAKRYLHGDKLPASIRYEELEDLSKWKLKAPSNSNRYIRIDNEVYEVSEDLRTVVNAAGIVEDLLK